MRHHRLLLVLLAALCITAFAPAQDAPPAAEEVVESEADRAFEPLRKDFGLLHRSLLNTGEILDEDRPAIQALRDRVDAFAAEHPEYAAAVAMQLQLCTWLGEDDRIEPLFTRLMELRPDDARIGMLWLQRLEQTAGAEPERIEAARQALFERFPDNVELLTGRADFLKDEARYEEAIALLEAAELDPAVEPEAVLTLADCLFAVHRFDEALETLESISTGPAPTRPGGAKSRAAEQQPIYEEQIELWAREQEIRAAEAAADDLPRVEIHTSKGIIVVELFENEAPNTVANFIKLAEDDFWVQTKFHRREPDFMIQGGDPNTKPDATGRPGLGNPGYTIPDEHQGDNHRNHFADSFAMAKRPDANSGGCQFYFNFRPTPWLNAKHTVFGRVVDGQDVVRSLRVDDEITMMVVLRKRDHAYEPATIPLNVIDTTSSTSSTPGG